MVQIIAWIVIVLMIGGLLSIPVLILWSIIKERIEYRDKYMFMRNREEIQKGMVNCMVKGIEDKCEEIKRIVKEFADGDCEADDRHMKYKRLIKIYDEVDMTGKRIKKELELIK
jgi:hypothetical protein